MHADKIYVLERGQIIETGTHQQLLNERDCITPCGASRSVKENMRQQWRSIFGARLLNISRHRCVALLYCNTQCSKKDGYSGRPFSIVISAVLLSSYINRYSSVLAFRHQGHP